MLHAWSGELKSLISSTIHDRKIAIASGESVFQPEYVEEFRRKVILSLAGGWDEQKKPARKEAANFEGLLLFRVDKYRDNYFRWVEDFRLPTTNNLSERGLMCVKSHMKTSPTRANNASEDAPIPNVSMAAVTSSVVNQSCCFSIHSNHR